MDVHEAINKVSYWANLAAVAPYDPDTREEAARELREAYRTLRAFFR